MLFNQLKENSEVVYKGNSYTVIAKQFPKVILKENDVKSEGKIIEEEISTLIEDLKFSPVDRQ